MHCVLWCSNIMDFAYLFYMIDCVYYSNLLYISMFTYYLRKNDTFLYLSFANNNTHKTTYIMSTFIEKIHNNIEAY